MNKYELAWAAGFFDGEGTFAVQNQVGKSPWIHASAAQTDRQVLDRLQRATGLGKVYGPYRPKNKNHSDYYYWRAMGFENAQAVAAMLWSFLSPVKREQYGRATRKLATGAVLKTERA